MGEEQRPSRRTVDRLRAVIGQPMTRPRTLVVRAEQPVLLASGELVAEDGTVTALSRPAHHILALGYYDHVAQDGSLRRIIAAPGRCHLPDRPAWGWAMQLYAVRSNDSWGIGDLGDLRRFVEWSTEN